MSQAKTALRDISGVLQIIREFLLGRKYTNALRFAVNLATRSPPPPQIPDGPAHKLSNNYYFSRDGRREVNPPLVIASQNLLSAGGMKEISRTKIPTPGKIYRWD